MPTPIFTPLDHSLLRAHCDISQFSFETTDDLTAPDEFVGQARALDAVTFGISIAREGFNIFALGPAGVGKRSIIQSILLHEAIKRPTPPDICYVHNFSNPRHPSALMLPPGQGENLANDMHQLIEILRTSIPAIFESKAYASQIKEIQEETRRKQEEAYLVLENDAESQGVAILRTGEGFMLAAKEGDKIVSEEEFDSLPKPERNAKESVMRKIHGQLTAYLEQIPVWQKEQRENIKELFKSFTLLQVGSAIDDLKKKYDSLPEVAAYLNDVQQSILESPIDFRRKAETPSLMNMGNDENALNRYVVNVIVKNANLTGAPVFFEEHPNFTNLVGRIDHLSHFGALLTDSTLIRSGALHKANGGYLIIDAVKLLTQPFAWEGLKRALRAREIRVENVNQITGFISTVSLEPVPIPLDIKVVLLGERQVYYWLSAYDPDFLELFKVAADFNEEIERSPENCTLFAQLLKVLLHKDKLKPLTKEAVGEVINYASRIIGDSLKISTHVRKLTDLLGEADYFASLEGHTVTEASDVELAIEHQTIRASRIKERTHEEIRRGSLLIHTEGEKVGQVNALSYVLLGGFPFGHPMRITARVGVGRGEVIDIEREAKLGGPIHSKGVLILSGYLNGHFARKKPLSLSASLVFEQSYGGIEGDSATIAEVCALISAITDVPIKQSIAVTGSMDQHGHVQPIGGVNEKIEGFFDVCSMRTLTGEQGVIIPKANLGHLMLRKDVVLAAKKGKFNIYAVETVDQALEILMGRVAGLRNQKGDFPKDSINYLATRALTREDSEKTPKPKPKRT